MSVQIRENVGQTRSLIGESIRSREAPRFVTGRGTYVDDIKIPGTAYMAVIRSAYPHAFIRNIDITETLKNARVLAVLTGEDVVKISNPLPRIIKGPEVRTVNCYCLPRRKVHYVGEPVAAVVATERDAAIDTAELVKLDYEPLRAVVDAEKALQDSAPVLYDELGDNVLAHYEFEGGDLDRAFSQSDFALKETIKIGRLNAAPMEPRAYLANYDRKSGSLTFWASTQHPHILRTILSEIISVPEPLIRVIQPDVGGAFGPKCPNYHEEALTCLFSMKLGRPVKYVEDRRENLMAMHQAREQTHHVEAAVKDGVVLGIKDKIIVNMGAYFPTEGFGFDLLTATILPGCYGIRNYRAQLIGVATNKTPSGAIRGYGKDTANFVIERLMDLIAKELGVDPVEIRLRNFVTPEEFPYRSITGQLYDSGNYHKCLKKVVEAVNYDSFKGEKEKYRGERRYVGVGFSAVVQPCSVHPSNSRFMGYDAATVRVHPSGKVTVLAGTTSAGMGHETVFAQVAAQELGMKIDDVTVVEGDTAFCPYGFGNFSSRTSIVGVTAVMLAARQIKERILNIAGHLLNANPLDLEIKEEKVSVKGDPSRFVTFQDTTRAVFEFSHSLPKGIEVGLEATSYYHPPTVETETDEHGQRNRYAAFSNSVNAAIVEIDIETARINILRYVSVVDCGKMLNPAIVEGQLIGGIAWGIGSSLLEESAYDENGQPLQTTFMDYAIPTSLDIPAIELAHMQTASPTLPLGAKGVGEMGNLGVGAALTNAVEDALSPFGIKITELPLTPQKLHRLIRQAKIANNTKS